MKIAVTTPEVVDDAMQVVEAAQKAKLITPKRLIVVAGVTAVTVGTVLLVKKVRAAKRAAREEAEEA